MSQTAKITVLICTYNRRDLLAKALESVAASQMPASVDWEVLVVNNNSTDQTREVVEDFCRKYPHRFRYLLETQQGKSYALNNGIREARGDILVFIDDDVVVDPLWLQNLTAALHNGDWAGAGGRIRTDPGFKPPPWLSVEGKYSMSGALVIFDRGDKPGKLDWAPYGANMAFRREMFEKYGNFRTDLGPGPVSLFRCEDTEFGERVMSAGERVRYEPSAIVYHPVQEGRRTKKYFLDWWFEFGRAVVWTEARRAPRKGAPGMFWGIAKEATTTLPKLSVRWMITVRPDRRFYYKVMFWRTAGKITEYFRLARGKDSAG